MWKECKEKCQRNILAGIGNDLQSILNRNFHEIDDEMERCVFSMDFCNICDHRQLCIPFAFQACWSKSVSEMDIIQSFKTRLKWCVNKNEKKKIDTKKMQIQIFDHSWFCVNGICDSRVGSLCLTLLSSCATNGYTQITHKLR